MNGRAGLPLGLAARQRSPTDTMQLFSKEYGQGRAVILLHGLFGSSDNWHFIAMQLAKQFHVLVLDQRNHGQSPHNDAMDYPLMAADVNEFMASRRIDRAIVVGHSMGGKTALQLALQFPERVEALVVEDIAPRAYDSMYDGIMAALWALDLPRFQTRQQMEEALAPAIPDPVLRRFLLKNLGRTPEGAFFWKIHLRGIFENAPHLRAPVGGARPFTKPALFIRGEKSDYIRPADEAGIRERFPRANIETIAGATHWVHSDRPEEFVRLILEFLS